MNKYVQICLYYGITEDIMNDYVYDNYFLESSENIINAKYRDYVYKCKMQKKKPLSEKEWYIKRNKIKKGLVIGSAAIATSLGVAGNLRHNKMRKKRAEEQKEMEEHNKEMQRKFQKASMDKERARNTFYNNHNERMKELTNRLNGLKRTNEIRHNNFEESRKRLRQSNERLRQGTEELRQSTERLNKVLDTFNSK